MARKGPPDSGEDDRRLWTRVTSTVTPPARRKAARVTPGAAPVPADLPPAAPSRSASRTQRPTPTPPVRAVAPAPPPPRPPGVRPAPEPLEPRRQRRLSRERDPIEATIDLHGHGRFEAEDALRAFLIGCQARGMRAVLVVTGQGRRGGGVIRQSFAEWMHAPALRGVVAGFAPSHRRHGGDGALYVTLKKRG